MKSWHIIASSLALAALILSPLGSQSLEFISIEKASEPVAAETFAAGIAGAREAEAVIRDAQAALRRVESATANLKAAVEAEWAGLGDPETLSEQRQRLAYDLEVTLAQVPPVLASIQGAMETLPALIVVLKDGYEPPVEEQEETEAE
jgi:hypothetical protein